MGRHYKAQQLLGGLRVVSSRMLLAWFESKVPLNVSPT